MSRIQKIMIVAVALLVLGVSDRATAQQEPDGTPQNEAQQLRGAGDATATGNQAGQGYTRQLGPGDGTGNQGVKPSDGSGFGLPGRLGGESGQGSKAASRARKSEGKRSSRSSGSVAGTRQRGSRQLDGGGPTGSLCDGSRRHSGLGGARSSRRGGSRR